jgi:hypothetical protein
MLTAVHRCIGFLMSVTAITIPTWSSCQAAGSFQTKPALPGAVTTEDDQPLPPTTTTWPNLSTSAFFSGCGRGRVSDPQAHGYHGPADPRSIAR